MIFKHLTTERYNLFSLLFISNSYELISKQKKNKKKTKKSFTIVVYIGVDKNHQKVIKRKKKVNVQIVKETVSIDHHLWQVRTETVVNINNNNKNIFEKLKRVGIMKEGI